MRIVTCLLLILSLSGCGSKPTPTVLSVGTIAGPETEIMETAQQVAKDKYGITIKIVAFNDYNLPNEALQDGSLDANMFQHQPYLQAAIKAHHYDLIAIGKSFVYPMGIYSKKYKTLNELPEQATIAVPNDPSNEMRALLLVQKAGLITLKSDGMNGLKDIDQNTKQLKFKEIDAAQLPRVLPDVDAALINTNFAIPAGLDPGHDALFIEDKDSPYANIIVIRKDSPKRQQLDLLVKAINSDEVKEKAQGLFGSTAIPAW